MGVVAGCISPHPPIIVQEVGGVSTGDVQSTITAMREVAARVSTLTPESLVVISPHSPYLPDSLPLRTDAGLHGSFAPFRAPQVSFDLRTDVELAEAILAEAKAQNLPVTPLESGDARFAMSMYGSRVDHGVLVPLYFLRESVDVPIVNLGLSFLPYDVHYRIGEAIHAAASKLRRKVVFVASGDLSHRLTPGAPAGYDPRGAQLDEQIEDALRASDFERLRHIDPELVEAGGECGLRSIITLTGCFADREAQCEVMSYEGPFGVGYLVGFVQPTA